MELFNVEKGKLRKKDTEAYYYDNSKKFIKVPSMTEKRESIYPFLKFCVSVSVPDVTDEMIDKVWEEAENKKEILLAGLNQMKSEIQATDDANKSFKIAAYNKAIKAIEALNVPVLSGAQALKLQGIGKGIAGVIDQLLRDGKLKSFEERMEGAAERHSITDKFLKIWDVKPKDANVWYNKGYKEIEDLAEISDTLTAKQKIGIKYYDDFQQKIPYERYYTAVATVRKILGIHTTVFTTGEIRTKNSSDETQIDIIIPLTSRVASESTGSKIVEELKARKFITEEGSLTAIKFSGVCRIVGDSVRRRIDITFVPENDAGTYILFETGPKSFLNNIKEQAAQLGYRLEKKGLFRLSTTDDADEKIEVQTEEDVFKELGMDYIEPQNRN